MDHWARECPGNAERTGDVQGARRELQTDARDGPVDALDVQMGLGGLLQMKSAVLLACLNAIRVLVLVVVVIAVVTPKLMLSSREMTVGDCRSATVVIDGTRLAMDTSSSASWDDGLDALVNDDEQRTRTNQRTTSCRAKTHGQSFVSKWSR